MGNILLGSLAKLFSFTNSRYVNRFVPVKWEYSCGRLAINTSEERRAVDDLKAAIENIKGMEEKYPFLNELEEVLFIVVRDLDDFRLTVCVHNGDAEVTVGWNCDKRPSFILPLFSQNLRNLREVTADGDIDLKEAYRIVRVLFIPFLKGLYQGDYSHLPKDKAYLNLDNFIQVEVFNEEKVEVEGFPGPARATVVNVDGQWLVFEGFQGDPDVRYSMNMKQALEFAYLIRVKMAKKDIKDFWALRKYVDRYNRLKEEVKTYERKWHNVSDLV
ncbi:hypothetical protein B5M47_02025 [candidate division CPR3 bacterium 4484_211]|uniref:Uncharacterized protein n=1 Tax=candidate division CPR3 bacterium 4484_211 TaxID=1968527 RepID=A0A1W9NY13_UNCC3|nr:MAG: hypothetical protein B5M47_02025 [candidate division CPR3 bacterium 4484_211]RLD03170.1 MAG: hypothetical protein DRI56_12945 [Chloroflexota bacterium]